MKIFHTKLVVILITLCVGLSLSTLASATIIDCSALFTKVSDAVSLYTNEEIYSYLHHEDLKDFRSLLLNPNNTELLTQIKERYKDD